MHDNKELEYHENLNTVYIKQQVAYCPCQTTSPPRRHSFYTISVVTQRQYFISRPLMPSHGYIPSQGYIVYTLAVIDA